MPSDENAPDASVGRSENLRLHERINPLLPIPAFLLVGIHAFHVLPDRAAYLLMFVWVCVYAFNQRIKAPISRVLPRIMLCVAVTLVSATVTIPKSWATPTAWLLLAIIALTALITKDWSTSLTSLFGLSVFAAGLGITTDAIKHSEALRHGGLPVYVLGAITMGLGALILKHRHAVLFDRGGVLDLLDAGPVLHARIMAFGLFSLLFAVVSATEGRIIVAILAGLSSGSIIGFSLASLFAKSAEFDAGVMAVILGISIIGLGVFALKSGDIFVEAIAMCAGVAIVGGGFSLIKRTEELVKLKNWLKYITTESGARHHRS